MKSTDSIELYSILGQKEITSPSDLDVSAASDVFADDTIIPFRFVDENTSFLLAVTP